MERKLSVVIYLLILMYVVVNVKCYLTNIEKSSQKLDELLVGVEALRYSRDSKRDMKIWQDYEFGTGVGNREELFIANITTRIDPVLSESINNYQLVEREGDFFLAGSNDHVFSLFKLDLLKNQAIYTTNVTSDRKILTFKILSLPNISQPDADVETIILAILCIESAHGTDLQWYRLTEKNLVLFWSWPVQKRVERLQFFHHEKQNRLLLLREANTYFQQLYSPIDIYGFNIVGERPNLWLSQKFTVPKTFDLQICSTYESTIMALQQLNDVVIYEYKIDKNQEGLFRERQNVNSNSLRNVICFESGYIRYLVTSGPEAALFDFFEGEFQHDLDSENLFNDVGEVSWIQSIPVDTYREESVLLVQLKNSTIIGLSWKGQGFEKISQPEFDFGIFDLSRATIIPKYGFIYGNKLVKIVTKLREKSRPMKDEMERLLQRKEALAEVLRKQELILDETEIRINQSYFVNPNVTGYWNISDVEVESMMIEDGVSYDRISIGTKTIAPSEFLSDLGEAKNILNDLESKLVEIKWNLAESLPINSTEVTLTGDLIIEGGFDVREKLFVTHFTVEQLNGFPLTEILQDFYNYDDNLMIEGEKTFESIDAENLNVLFINDVPISDVMFDNKKSDYSKIDFSKLTKLKVEGDLHFSNINGVNWEKLMKSVIMKSQPTKISGVTIVEGDLIARNIEIDRLNGHQYPGDFVLTNSTHSVELTGKKKFGKLTVSSLDLDNLKTINGVSIDRYVTLNGDRTLTEEITFENFVVTEILQIDGKITGLPYIQQGAGLTLNETSTITSDVVFAKLTVLGDLEVENLLNGTNWSMLDDLVSKKDQFVEITGRKTFLKEVEVGSEMIIESQRINDHSIQEFVTLDTEQVFPNLEMISGNVTFNNVIRGDLESLNKLLIQNLDENDQPKCLKKSVLFKVSPIVEHLFLNKVNGNRALDFSKAVNKTFASVNFQNLEVLNLRAREISLMNLNGKNFEELKRRRISKTKPQRLIGDYEIEILETGLLNARTVDEVSIEKLESLRIQLDDVYNGILNGSLSIDTLTVGGTVNSVNINGEPLQNIYRADSMGIVIFPKDVYIENLTVLGFVNGINFTEFVDDAVFKTDTNVIITGHKAFNQMNCQILDASKVNGKIIDHILDPNKHQILSGSMKVNGTVKILDHFETQGKISGVSWQKIQQRFQYLGNNTYSLSGDLSFTSSKVNVKNLIVTNSIQGVRFNDFLDSIVYKNSTKVKIYGPLIFKDPVTIDTSFMIIERFNDLDLKYFYENAVRIDRPFAVKSKVVFTENIAVEEDLMVGTKLEAKAIGGVNLSELYANAAYVDRPTFISGTVTLENVVFESNIQVETLNDMDLRSVITLNEDQTLPGTFHCMDIAVGKLDISGTFNDHDLGAIYDNTFKLTGNQNISGHIVVIGNVQIRHDFDPNLINGVNPVGLISLDGNDTLIGNFVFEKPLVLRGNLFSRETINDIDVSKWQAAAVTTSFPFEQIVRGDWTIHGNVHFEKDVFGSEFLDDVNVTKLADDLHRRDVETELIIDDMKKDLRSICDDLAVLKKAGENQIYKYKYFDYLQILNFDRSIVSVHHFESDDFDYLLINFDTCHLDIFLFTGTEFKAVISVPDIGLIEHWFTFHFEGEIYFLTVGKYSCNKNSGNLWKLVNDQFIHVDDLGNVTDAKKMSENEFLLVVNDVLIHRSIMEIYQRSLSKPKTYAIGSDNVKFVSDSRQVLLMNRDSVYEYQFANGTGSSLKNCFGTDDIRSFRLGVNQREIFIYYDEKLSEDYLFISDNNLFHRKILQTIKAQQVSSFLVLNFDGFVENFLIFLENGERLQIYEYRGFEGFVYRETINIKAKRIFNFKLRKYSKIVKKHCIAVLQGSRLVILEAKMYGEKLEIKSLPCEN